MAFSISRVAASFACAFILAAPIGAAAQAYPDHLVRLIVPFPPGGGTDQVGRFFAQKLSEVWGQSVVVDNMGGAGGNIGTHAGARATPDGYTLTLVTNSVTINHTLYANIPFDVTKDFAPISMLCSAPMAVVASPKVPITSIAELVAYAKKNPGVLNYGTAGIGTPQHLAAELYQSVTDTKLTHVPYRGAGPAMQGLLAGDLQLVFATLTTVDSNEKAGTIKVLASTDATRSPAYPKLPTVAESGYPTYPATLCYALVAPDKTPPAIVAKINSDLRKILASPETKAKLETMGFQPGASSPAELHKTIADDIGTWAAIIKRLSLKASD